MRIRVPVLGLMAALCLAPPSGAAQQSGSFPIALELRGGLAVPAGDFADAAPGIGATAGPHVAAAVLWNFTAVAALSIGYSSSWLGCDRCAVRGIGDQVMDTGFEGGVQVRLPSPLGSTAFWLSTVGVFHELVFQDEGSTLSSDHALGIRASGGVALPVSRFISVKPGVHYTRYSADLDLGIFPDQTVNVSTVSLDVGIAFRF